MCIRDRVEVALGEAFDLGFTEPGDCAEAQADRVAFIVTGTVSYTHLTLPTSDLV